MLPKVINVTKGFLHQVREKGVATAVVGFLWGKVSRRSAADIKEDVSIEAMTKQCLAFYLEQYETLLLQDEEFPKEFRVDQFTKTLSTIYFQLLNPWVKYRNGSHAEVTTIKPIQAVSYCRNTLLHLYIKTANLHVCILLHISCTRMIIRRVLDFFVGLYRKNRESCLTA